MRQLQVPAVLSNGRIRLYCSLTSTTVPKAMPEASTPSPMRTLSVAPGLAKAMVVARPSGALMSAPVRERQPRLESACHSPDNSRDNNWDRSAAFSSARTALRSASWR